MGNTIALLDDEPERVALMEPLLRERYALCDVATFDNSPEMVQWLEDHLSVLVLICLDHDLVTSFASR